MPDAALSERRTAALEDASSSDAMKPAAGKTGRHGRADVGTSQPPGMEGPNAGKARRSGRADTGSSDRAPGIEASSCARKARRNGRADMGKSGAMKLAKIAPAEAAVEPAAGKTGGDGRRARVKIGRDVEASADAR